MPEMPELSIGKVMKLTGFTRRRLRGFCKSGLLVPRNAGTRDWWYYSFRQILGIVFAGQFAEQASRKQIGAIISFVMNHTEAELQRKFRAGRRILFPYGDLKLVKNEAAEGSEFDLSRTFELTKEAVAIFAKQSGSVVVSK